MYFRGIKISSIKSNKC